MATDPLPSSDPLASSAFQSAVFDEYLDNARAHAAQYLRRLPDRHVGARASREELLSALRIALPRQACRRRRGPASRGIRSPGRHRACERSGATAY